MTQFIYSDFIPDEVKFFTAGKRYEILEKFNDYKEGTEYQVRVIGDDGKTYGPINVGWPCAYLDDKTWTFEDSENDGTEQS